MSVSLIAEKAGVSIATVSRVINNSRPVNPQTAEAVRRAIAELQLPARQIRRRSRSRSEQQHATIAIVSLGQSYAGWFQLPVIASVVGELTRTAQDQQMNVLMAEMPDPQVLSPVLRRAEVDGALVFIRSGLTSRDTAVLRDHLPIVRVLGGQLAPVEIDHVGADNNSVGYLAAEYLLSKGLRDLAFLTLEPSWDFSKLRAQGFLAAAEAAGLAPRVGLLSAQAGVPVGLYGPNPIVDQNLPDLIRRLLTPAKGPVGLFVSRDEETVQIYRLLRDAGLEPGRDVIVVSCDNEDVRLSTLHPRPASIDLGAAEIARHAVQRLASRLKHRDQSPTRILVNPRLVPGDNDAPR